MAAYRSSSPSTGRSTDAFVRSVGSNRIELPRESMRHIQANKVKRTTALFEGSDTKPPSDGNMHCSSSAPNFTGTRNHPGGQDVKRDSSPPKPCYPYRPARRLSSDEDKGINKSEVSSPMYPYNPTKHSSFPNNSPVEVISQPEYPYRPKQLDIKEGKKPGTSNVRVQHVANMHLSSASTIGPTKTTNSKPIESASHNSHDSASDQSNAAVSVAHRSKLFENVPIIVAKPQVFKTTSGDTLKAFNDYQEDEEDITPTNDKCILPPKPKNPQYSKVNKSKKSSHNIRKLQKHLSLEDTIQDNGPSLPPRTSGIQVLPGKPPPMPTQQKTVAGTPVQVGPQPPPKPPRTFAHDEYVKVKELELAQNQVARYGETEAHEISSSNPFYEEVKENGTIRRNPHKKAMRNRSKDTTNDSISNSLPPEGLYEKVEDTAHVALKPGSTSSTPSTQSYPPVSKPAPPPRPKHLSSGEVLSANKTSRDQHADDTYYDHALVKVLKPTSEMPRKLSKVIVGRGIHNPGYSRQHEVISSQLVERSLKRYRSDECLYADPAENRPLRQTDPVLHTYLPGGYGSPLDARRITLRAPGTLTRNAHGVDIDVAGYAMPYNALNQQVYNTTPYRKRSGTLGSDLSRSSSKSRPAPLDLASSCCSGETTRETINEAYSLLRCRTHRNHSATQDSPAPIDEDDSDTEVDQQEQLRKLEHVAATKDRKLSTKQSTIYASAMLPGQRKASNQLYSYAMIVGLEPTAKDNIYQPKVLYTFPHQNGSKKQIPKMKDMPLNVISSFCFPDASNWRPVNQYTTESYSFVLTNERGDRQYGYCLRFLPPGPGDRLPEVLCIISSLQLWNFYNNLLEELYKKRKQSMESAQELLQAAYGRVLPEPGQEAWIKTSGKQGDTVTKPAVVYLRRPSDKRLEKVDFELLSQTLRVETIMKVVGSMLLERRVIFIARHLGTLTKCVHALLALLYPFSWPHTFIPILPVALVEVVHAPTPFLIGLLTSHLHEISLDELNGVFIVDIDNDDVIRCEGDESRIIPQKLQKALLAALKVKDTGSAKQMKSLLPEAFLRLFIETMGHYTECLSTQQNGRQVFQKEMFVRAVSSKSIRMFLEWFSETQLFEAFIQDKIDGPPTVGGLFELRLEEYREEMERYSPGFRHNVKEAGKKLKNFFVESGTKLKKAFRPMGPNVYV